MDQIKALLRKLRTLFFKLNEEQRKHVSKIFHMLGLGAALPIFIQIATNQKSESWLYIVIWIAYAIIFEIIAIAALSERSQS